MLVADRSHSQPVRRQGVSLRAVLIGLVARAVSIRRAVKTPCKHWRQPDPDDWSIETRLYWR